MCLIDFLFMKVYAKIVKNSMSIQTKQASLKSKADMEINC